MRTVFIISVFAVLLACNTQTKTPTNHEIVAAYYQGLNTANFSQLDKILSDSIVWTEMGFEIATGKEACYNNFQWDSVFQPSYTIVEEKSLDSNTIGLVVAKSCRRIRFLQDSAIVTKSEFKIEDGFITEIKTTDYLYFDTFNWTNNRQAIVEWIRENHPELDGFMYNQSTEWAEKYVKAIEYWEAEME